MPGGEGAPARAPECRHAVFVRGVTPCVAQPAQRRSVSDCAACVTGCEEHVGSQGGWAAPPAEEGLLELLESVEEFALTNVSQTLGQRARIAGAAPAITPPR